MLLDDPDYDSLDVGYCPRCGRDMAGEPLQPLRRLRFIEGSRSGGGSGRGCAGCSLFGGCTSLRGGGVVCRRTAVRVATSPEAALH